MIECNSCGGELIKYIMGSPNPRGCGGPRICVKCRNGEGVIAEGAEALRAAVKDCKIR